jgi:mannonate dehydratase
VSNQKDYIEIFTTVPSLSNGICFCTGSQGVDPANNLEDMLTDFADRIHFLLLRITRRNLHQDFFETDYLDGDTDMYKIIRKIVSIMEKRAVCIPVRPDHGHRMLDDLHKKTNPGYTAIGRLRGLAEIRGLEMGIRGSLRLL